MTVATKRCARCGEEKPVFEFDRDKTRIDGLHGWCKQCVSTYKHEYYEMNRERIMARNREYREKNKDIVARCKREYYARNRDIITQRNREYQRKTRNTRRVTSAKADAAFEVFVCEVCGAEFVRRRSYVDWDRKHLGITPRFCSAECADRCTWHMAARKEMIV